jgi:magnesium chelatase family protein
VGCAQNPAKPRWPHNGILFLDELPEFTPQALDALRQPLEQISVS